MSSALCIIDNPFY